MDECLDCQTLDEAFAAALERRRVLLSQVAPSRMVGGRPRFVPAEQLIAITESGHVVDAIRAERTAHIKECARHT